MFLDDMSVAEAEKALGMRLVPVESGGADFVNAVLSDEYHMERENDNFVYVQAYDREQE